MSATKFLCDSETLIDGEFVELQAEADGRRMFLIGTRYQGQARVWLNVCPHQGRPLNWAPNQFLKDAEGQLVCAAHGAVFELEQGACVSGPCQKAALTALDIDDDGTRVHFRTSD